MSFEHLLLIAFLVVLPLMQHLVRYLRRQNELREQAEGQPPPLRRPAAREEPLPLPRAARRSDPDAIPAHAPPLLADFAAARRAPPGRPVVRRSHPIDLRHAIVMMTLLGPCRAASPHDWPDSSERP
jgi:hypothetical protein